MSTNLFDYDEPDVSMLTALTLCLGLLEQVYVVVHLVAVLQVDFLALLHVHVGGLRVASVSARLVQVTLLLSFRLVTFRVQPPDDFIVDHVVSAQFAIALLAEVVKGIFIDEVGLAEILRLQPVRERVALLEAEFIIADGGGP